MGDVKTKEPRRIYLIDWSSFEPINNKFLLCFATEIDWDFSFCWVNFCRILFLFHLNFNSFTDSSFERSNRDVEITVPYMLCYTYAQVVLSLYVILVLLLVNCFVFVYLC